MPLTDGNDSGWIRGPATTIMRSSGIRRLASGTLWMIRSSRRRPTAVPPTAATTTRSPTSNPSRAYCRLVGVPRRVEVLDVAWEREVRFRPVADARQLGAERVRYDVCRIADEQGVIAH